MRFERALTLATLLLAAASLVACESAPHARSRETTLYLGTKIGEGPGAREVTDAEWDAFVKGAIVPRLPAGCTLGEARGAWRGGSGAIETEKTHTVVLVHEEGDASDAALDAIAAEWKKQFRQESVLRVDARVAARFE
jgi:hypothetical protein